MNPCRSFCVISKRKGEKRSWRRLKDRDREENGTGMKVKKQKKQEGQDGSREKVQY